jgi:Zinc carboxypeptidase.
MNSVYNNPYKTGTACEVLYPTTGSAEDYAWDVVGATYSLTIELPPRTHQEGKKGKTGFHLPKVQIARAGEEAFEGVREMMRFIVNEDNCKEE